MSAPFEFAGFPRREGEHPGDYMERWNKHQLQYRPWEHAHLNEPAKVVQVPGTERQPGEDDE